MKYLFYLTLLLFTITLNAQSDCVTGRVVDADSGTPLIGVSVLLEGTNHGTVTDFEGDFKLCGLPAAKKQTLMLSYTGYETNSIKSIPGDSLGYIQLSSGGAVLEEIVVVGYSTQRKTSVSGAVRGISVNRMQSSRKISKRTAQPEPVNNESYNKIARNGFIKTEKQNFSTISTDVDRAAYANVRRFLNQGQLPPADAVRTEEMINYFNYQDPDPATKNDIALRTEIMACPWNTQNELLRVSARTMPIATADIPASNLVFLLDVSGSMNSADKLPLVKESLKMLTRSLRPQDRVAIVVYAGAAGMVLPSTAGSDPAKIIAALDRLQAGGSTAGGAGINLAYSIAQKNFIQDGNNRIILATDGDFNVGVSSQDKLIELIEDKRKSGVFLTVLGFGTGNYQEGTMQLLADKGNGNHGYIDSPAEARKILVQEFGGTLYTVAKDVKLQLEFDPRVISSYRLIGYENRLLNKEDFDDDKKDAAEMGAGHNVTVLYELVPAKGCRKYTSLGTLNLRYKPGTASRSVRVSQPVILQKGGNSVPSEDLRWSAGVAEFAMLLTDSKHKGAADWAHCLEMIKNAKGDDPNGYRTEMIGLVEKAQSIIAARKR